MRKLYLHIGTEKTGTTTIQEFLYINKKALLKNGYHVLRSAGKRNHRDVPSYCMSDEHYDDFFLDKGINDLEKKNVFRDKFYKSFRKEILSLGNDVHSVIISSEHFHSRLKTVAEIFTLKELVSELFSEVEIICYLREQSSLALSLYSTGIKSGVNVEFNRFLANCNPDNYYYNYSKILDCWSEVFSISSLNIRVFDKATFYNHDLLDDFCFAIDKDLIEVVDRCVSVKNESLSNFGKMIGRAINSISPRYNQDGSVNQSRRRAINRVAEGFSGNDSGLSYDQYTKIYESFNELNVEVARKYFNRDDTIFSFKPPSEEGEMLNENHVSELANIILDIKGIRPVSDEDAILFRDSAILLEKIDIKMAYKLMKLAQIGRPNGSIIRKKLQEYSGKI